MTEGINIFVSGQTGSGKTHLVLRAIADCPRLLVYQTKREEHEYPGVYFDGLAGERELMLRFWQYSVKRCDRFRLVYRPRDPWDFEEFNAIAGLAYQAGDMHFVCEELGGYVKSTIFSRREYGMEFKTLLTAGRTRGVTCWLMSQRPMGIPVEVRSESREAFIFHSGEPGDVDYISRRFGSETEIKMAACQEYQHVHWSQGGKPEIAKCSA